MPRGNSAGLRLLIDGRPYSRYNYGSPPPEDAHCGPDVGDFLQGCADDMADLFRKTMFAVVWSVGLLLLVPASGTSAQSSSLGGRVTDPRDAGLPGVTVVASSERLTAPVLVTTD